MCWWLRVRCVFSAAAWAALVATGEAEYVARTKAIMQTKMAIETVIGSEIPGLHVIGKPSASVVAFTATKESNVNVFAVGEAMGKRGWNLNTLQNPPGLHICITFLHTKPGVLQRFKSNLTDAVEEVRANPNGFKHGIAAIYGMATAIPDKTMIAEFGKGFLDALYKAVKPTPPSTTSPTTVTPAIPPVASM